MSACTVFVQEQLIILVIATAEFLFARTCTLGGVHGPCHVYSIRARQQLMHVYVVCVCARCNEIWAFDTFVGLTKLNFISPCSQVQLKLDVDLTVNYFLSIKV